MTPLYINTRADLDALQGTPQHDQAMAMLGATMWRLEKDEQAKEWRVVEDTSTIERFNLEKKDFPGAVPPEPPVYVETTPAAPEAVSMRQARLALLQVGLLQAAEDAISGMTGVEGDVARIEWQYAQEVRRSQPLVQSVASALGLDDDALAALFEQASKL